MAHGLKSKPYEEGCHKFNILSLEQSRARGDLIKKFKLPKSIRTLNWHFHPQSSMPRGGRRSMLRRKIVRCCNQRYNFSNNGIVNLWNGLSDEIINSDTISFKKFSFKKKK
ncbi:RNA-directed DNA polymerase from mobile element jockey-like [Brachionus plicatilis]|uniref:RNA-directed DNA polymerase from mobile element jockey-like n=1 Tax=Brachionus plicatilis TaxID=10195 RepID=A0A3M7SWM4_BRAPC|nr:RNA-directed DNA polymerase from mobile element jockey-like [Brachionus plicatilis]